jgi:hypothetical protein
VPGVALLPDESDARGEELSLKRIPTPLPRSDAHRLGDQRFAALASTGRAVLSAWSDLGGSLGSEEWETDVAMNVSSMPGSHASETASTADASRYASRLQALFCRHLADCCLAPTTFDYATCQAGNTSAAVTAATPLLGRGMIDVSRSGIDACVHATVDTACASLDGAALHAMDGACGGSVVGRIALGAPGCVDDVECAPGAYCTPADGAGVRSCVAWKEDGQACDTPTACNPVGPLYEYYSDTGTCAPAKAVGEACHTYFECSSGICDGQSNLCLASTPMADPGVPGGFCDVFTQKGSGTP